MAVLPGCDRPESVETGSVAEAPKPATGVTLRVRVIGDPTLADAFMRYQGEWAARFGGQLKVERSQPGEDLADDHPPADVLIYPASRMGTLAEHDRLMAVRKGVLRGEAYQANDIFPLVRQCTARWGDRELAMPLGAPVLVLIYRADLFARMGLAPPETWTAYGRLLEKLSDPAAGDAAGDREANGSMADPPWIAAVEPTSGVWAAHLLLARAAPYAKPADQYSTLFDMETMEPLIDRPPFVRALSELRQAYQSVRWPRLDPTGAREALLTGRTAMAITWLSAARPHATVTADTALAVVPLPGSKRVFRSRSGEWASRDAGRNGRVPYVGFAGRVGSVSRSCRNAPTAFRFLAWAGSTEMSSRICAASPATTLFRYSQSGSAGAWVDPGLSTKTVTDYAHAVEDQLVRTNALTALRIPAADQYLAALAEGVRRVLDDRQPPEQSLTSVADQWRKITADRGIDRQKLAYQKNLGLGNGN
ncbi:MAG: extracellular solute-binding protein [Pirellulales bacterium]